MTQALEQGREQGMQHGIAVGSPEQDGCLVACQRLRDVVTIVRDRDPSPDGAAYRAVGPHVRHCFDHFVSLIDGLAEGLVDYDDRAREETLETEPSRFLAELDRVVDAIRSLDANGLRRSLRVRHTVAPGSPPVTADSSLSRELAFLSGHTIHHLALIGAIADRRGIQLPEELYLAFSSAAHRRTADSGC